MKTMRSLVAAGALLLLLSCAPKAEAPKVEGPKPDAARPEPAKTEEKSPAGVKNPMNLTDDEWKKRLTPEEFYVCRQQGTERPFTGKLLNYHGDGIFVCKACDNPLFEPTTKFESGSGWPSFWKTLGKDAVTEKGDLSHGMSRVEVNCAKCGSHLGHVFDDGPKPTGLRYCMNSVALKIKEKDEKK